MNRPQLSFRLLNRRFELSRISNIETERHPLSSLRQGGRRWGAIANQHQPRLPQRRQSLRPNLTQALLQITHNQISSPPPPQA